MLRRVIRLEVGDTKNGEGREVKMRTSVYNLLVPLVIGKQPNDHVFTRPDGRRVKDLRRAWKAACVKAGLGRLHCPRCSKSFERGKQCPTCKATLKYEGLYVHDLRRSGVRAMRRSGTAEKTIMKIAGIKTRSIFDRYNITDQTDADEAIDRLEAKELEEQAKMDTLSRSWVRVEPETAAAEAATIATNEKPN